MHAVGGLAAEAAAGFGGGAVAALCEVLVTGGLTKGAASKGLTAETQTDEGAGITGGNGAAGAAASLGRARWGRRAVERREPAQAWARARQCA